MFDPGFLKGPVGVIVFVDIVLCGDSQRQGDKKSARSRVYSHSHMDTMSHCVQKKTPTIRKVVRR